MLKLKSIVFNISVFICILQIDNFELVIDNKNIKKISRQLFIKYIIELAAL